MRGKWILISGTVVVLAIAAGALSRLRREPAKSPVPISKVSEPAPLPTEVSLPGRIQAQHVVPVAAPGAGTVEEFLVDVGQEVYEGQPLARIGGGGLETAQDVAKAAVDRYQSRVDKLDAGIISARLEASRARATATRARLDYDRAEKAYQRQKMLNAAGATPRLVYEKAAREYESVQAEFRSLDVLARQAESRVTALSEERDNARRVLEDKNRMLEDATANLQAAEVLSPVNGIVIGRSGEVGRALGSREQQELFRIAVDLGALEVVLDPEPPVMSRIHTGQEAMVLIADLQGQGLPGVVKEIQNNQVIVSFNNPTPIIKPGMTAQVRIKLD